MVLKSIPSPFFCMNHVLFRHLTYSISCIFSCISQSVKGKDDVFHSPEPQLSQRTVNHAGVVETSGKLWEGRTQIRAERADLPSFFFFFSASGCWYIFIIICQSLLPSQHIKFSSKSVSAFVWSHLPCFSLSAVISRNRMTDPSPRYPNQKICCRQHFGCRGRLSW